MKTNKELLINVLSQPQIVDMLSLIRMRKGLPTSIEDLRSILNVSRSTADKNFNILSGKDSNYPLVIKNGAEIEILSEKALFLGISIGSKYVRTALIGLDLEPLELEKHFPRADAEKSGTLIQESDKYSYAFKISSDREDKLDAIKNTIQKILSVFIDNPSENTNLPLLGIGFSVTGPVDYKEKVWKPVQRLTSTPQMELGDLIGFEYLDKIKDQSLFLSFDNNAKSACISEYEWLMKRNHGKYQGNLSVVYVGSGIGLGSIIDGKLFRGGDNITELGHVYLLLSSSKSQNDNSEPTSPWYGSIESLLLSNQSSKLQSTAATNPNGATNQDIFNKEYLPYVLHLINCMMGTNRFIMVGHTVAKNKNLNYEILDQRQKFSSAPSLKSILIEKGRQVPYTSAIGAAIESFFSLISYKQSSSTYDRINLASEISWKNY